MSVPLRPARNELRYAWLGEVYVDLTANQLHDHGRETRLTPKAMAVLRELMLRQNLVVRRDDLLGLVWRDGFPTDDVLTHAVKELRRALGDDPRQPAIIETIPRVGYRLRASVRAVPGPESHDAIVPPLAAANDAPELHPESPESAAVVSAALAAAAARVSARSEAPVTPGIAAPAEAAPTVPGAASPSSLPAPPRNRGLRYAGIAFGVLAVGAALVAAFQLGRSDTAAPPRVEPAVPPVAIAERPAPVAITSDPGSEYFPALSPDGSSVAYVAAREGTTDDALLVKSRDPAALAVTLVPERAGVWLLRPMWSPDGARISFAEVDVAGDTCLLRVVPASGGAVQTVSPCETGLIDSGDWSPDGRTLYTSLSYTSQPGSRGIAAIDAASGESTLLEYTPREPDDADVGPRVSPDGRSIVFRRGASPYSDLWIMPVEGGQARLLAKFGAGIRGHAWTPDGGGVIASSDHSGQQALYRVDVASGAIVPLGIEDANFPNVARRAGYVAYHLEYELSQMVVYDLRDGVPSEGRLVAPASRPDFVPVLSPSGRRLAFISERSGEPQVWVHDFDTGQASALSAEDHSMPEMPQWAPDESAVLYVSRSQATSRLVHVDLATRRRSWLTPEDERVRFGSFSHDGQWLLYSSDRSGNWQAWRMRNDGTGAEQLSFTGGIDPRSWPGDEGIWYSKPMARGLFRWDPKTGEETRVTDLIGYTSLGAYTIANGEIWLYQDGADRRTARVLARPVAGGVEADAQARPVMELGYPGGTPWAMLSFDQARTRAVTNVVVRDGTDVFVTPLP